MTIMTSARPLVLGLALSLATLAGVSAASPGKGGQAVAQGANYDAGVQAFEAHNYAEAVHQLEIAIVANPKNPDSFFRLGQSHRALGNYRRALKYIRLALEIEPNHLAALKERGIVLLEAGEPDEAKTALERLGEMCDKACPEYESLKKQVEAAPAKKDG